MDHACLDNGSIPVSTRYLVGRIDWLTLAYDPPEGGTETVRRRWRSALSRSVSGTAVRTLGGAKGELTAAGGGRVHLWRSEAATARLKASGTWPLETIFSGRRWASGATLDSALERARAMARSFGWRPRGDARDRQCERTRRIDLCADFVGFPLASEDAQSWVAPSRGRVTWAPTEAHRHGRGRCSGIYVCRGADVSLVVYDKTLELTLRARASRDAEHAIWAEHGWDGVEPVTRVEARFRSGALREVDVGGGASLREQPDALEAHLGRLWGYATTRWARLIVPERGQRASRCRTDPRWEAVQAAPWTPGASVERRRVRGGATAEQAVGSLLSYMAASGKLDGIDASDPQAVSELVFRELRHGLCDALGESASRSGWDYVRERYEGARARRSG